MKRAIVPAFLTIALNSCQSQTPPQDTVLPVENVSFPATVTADQDLPITLTVGIGGCQEFRRIVAVRTPEEVRLTVLGNRTVPPEIACTAEIRFVERTYLDPGSASRADHFGVVVNARSWGTVRVASNTQP
ncbi:hypothetical protein DEDE109153_12400 [Deinococcus deserti]|uniref:Uncharacterized protein n=1 Tax=Deinococcus deserti (strain DSM 17065 / CIP 109153 / LMG 22923 / VCD115) TaxID=546414 RepID=C1D2U0_DEIDV|nr:hypothetical protein [Deinococcus deserti]ACO47729.1 Conserved hypothetical protein, precursor [Deinococcus deserti VCD115]